MKKILFWTVFLITISTACLAENKSEPNIPTAKEILAKYAKTRESMNSFILRYEDHLQGQIKKGCLGEIRSDGKRHLFWEKAWGYRPDLPSNSEDAKKDVRANYFLWNSENWFQCFHSDEGAQRDSIFILKKTDYQNRGHGVEKDFKIRYLWDTLYNFYYKVPFPDILAELNKAQIIRLQPKKNIINGSSCFVIEAETSDSEFKIWIDPQHSCQIAKAEVVRKASGKEIDKDPTKSIQAYIRNVKFRKFADLWIPFEANYGYSRELPDNKFIKEDHYIAITDFQLNPDHQSEDSFEPVFLRNGSMVQIVNGPRQVFIWQDGKVIDKDGKVIMDCTGEKKDFPGQYEDEGETEPNMPTVKELLDKYAATQDKLRTSFISKSEITANSQVSNRLSPQFKKGTLYEVNRKREIRSDGNRHYAFIKKWGDNAGREPTTEERSNYNYNLWDGIYRYQYLYSPDRPATSAKKNGLLFLTRKDNITVPQQLIRDSEEGGFFFGSSERIDSELRRADSLSIRPETEEINGSQCYVIDAKAKGCEYSIWIDPEHGYNISKAIIKRGWVTAGDPKEYNNPLKGNTEVSLTNVNFKKINDVWLTAEYDYSYNIKYLNGDYEITNYHYKIVEFVLNPDHDALGSFEPNFIRNGALVDVIGFPPGIRFTWHDDKVVDKAGKVIMDCTVKKKEVKTTSAEQDEEK